MKKTFLLIAVIATICFSSCSVGRIKDLEMKPTHAIVIAKVDIMKEGSTYITNEWDIAWNNSKKYFANCDSNGYVYMKLPVKKSSITNLFYKEDELKLPIDWYFTDIKESTIYYIGDISIYWDSLEVVSDMLYKQEQTAQTGAVLGGLIGAAIAGEINAENRKNMRNEQTNAVIVKDNYVETTKYFKNLFPTDKIIKKALLQVKSDTIQHKKQ